MSFTEHVCSSEQREMQRREPSRLYMLPDACQEISMLTGEYAIIKLNSHREKRGRGRMEVAVSEGMRKDKLTFPALFLAWTTTNDAKNQSVTCLQPRTVTHA